MSLLAFVGCYGHKDPLSLHLVTLEEGRLTLSRSWSVLENPSFLKFHNDTLYAVNEKDQGAGDLVRFLVDQQGELTQTHKVSSEGWAPCHLTLANKQIWVSLYGEGCLTAFDAQELTLQHRIQHQGKGANTERQAGPHVHSSIELNGLIICADLGLDQLLMYQTDGTQVGVYQEAPGAGPRHLACHPKRRDRLYLVNELNNSLSVFSVGGHQLEKVQVISTLPEDWQGESWAAELCFSPDGRFLYVSNRGHDSVVQFAVNASGELEVLDWFATQGEFPRHMRLTPEGDYLLVANQLSHNLVLFERDGQSGQLRATGGQLALTNPVCIEWLSQ